jgi:hypothetical protein
MVEAQGHQESKLFIDLIGEDILNQFLYDLINPETEFKIIDFSIKLLKEYNIPANQSDIYVKLFSSESNSFNIQISENLENELKMFEMFNPEYFI